MAKRTHEERVEKDRWPSEVLYRQIAHHEAAGDLAGAARLMAQIPAAHEREDADYARRLEEARRLDAEEAAARETAAARRARAERKRAAREAAEDAKAEALARRRAAAPAGWTGLEDRVPVAPWKDRVTLRVDREVLRWFRRQGPGYQTRINAVLRAYWEAKRDGVV